MYGTETWGTSMKNNCRYICIEMSVVITEKCMSFCVEGKWCRPRKMWKGVNNYLRVKDLKYQAYIGPVFCIFVRYQPLVFGLILTPA